ncbi:hypothetical protein F511_36642, partial [Dorcoceras hygrometricum]
LIGKKYEIFLNNSLQALLASLQQSNPANFSGFIPNFQELVQSKVDPPLESIWVLTALSFNDDVTPKIESLDRILAIKDFFQLTVSHSASCNLVKRIALVAPVVCKLHYCILEAKDIQLGSKKVRKVNREFEKFFSLSPDIVKRVRVEACGMMDLAGFVVAGAIMLKLCLIIQEEGFGEKIQNELKYWLVGSITGFQSSHIYGLFKRTVLPNEIVLKCLESVACPILSPDEHLQDPVLSITSDVVSWHATYLSYNQFWTNFLQNPEYEDAHHAKRIAFTKLMVTHEAIQFFRARDQIKAITNLNAFAMSSLPSQIIQWVRKEIGNESSASGPSESSPRSFLRWMLNIENRGIKIFDDDLLKFREKFILESSVEESEQPARCEDHKGEEEHGDEEDEKISESMSNAFMAAAHSIQSSEQGRRKRKTKNIKRRKLA